MSKNTLSFILALILTALSLLIGSKLIYGTFDWKAVVVSLIILLPVCTIIFALSYLLLNKLIPIQNRFIKFNETTKIIEQNVNQDITSFRLSYEYIFIGIIVLTICLVGVFWISDELSLIFLILIITHLATNPYRVDFLNDDSLVIHRLFRKKKIKISEIKSVLKGSFRDKIVLNDDYFYLDHLISNISKLTNTLAEKIEGTSSLKSVEHVELPSSNKAEIIIRTVLIILVAIFSSVFAVFYLNEFVKHL